MSAGAGTDSRDWGSLLVALGITVLDIGSIGGVVYADVTTTVTEEDFAAYQERCVVVRATRWRPRRVRRRALR
jgi:hypothetical protein